MLNDRFEKKTQLLGRTLNGKVYNILTFFNVLHIINELNWYEHIYIYI